jgi:putative oxidoreductase
VRWRSAIASDGGAGTLIGSALAPVLMSLGIEYLRSSPTSTVRRRRRDAPRGDLRARGAGRRDQPPARESGQGGLEIMISTRWAPYLQSVLRIVVAFLFIAHGTQKLFAFPVAEPRDPVPLVSLLGLAALLETLGGLLLLVGLFTRPVAFLVSGEMAVAYFMAHAPHGFWPLLNGGEPAVLFCFVWLYLAAAGPGPWSLDALWRGNGAFSSTVFGTATR